MVNQKILIAEDNAIIAMEIQRNLKDNGYQIPIITSTCEETVKETLKQKPDAIILDMDLKGEIDSIEASKKISKLKIPIIFLSSFFKSETLERLEDIPYYVLLHKPFTDEELRRKINLILNRKYKIRNRR